MAFELLDPAVPEGHFTLHFLVKSFSQLSSFLKCAWVGVLLRAQTHTHIYIHIKLNRFVVHQNLTQQLNYKLKERCLPMQEKQVQSLGQEDPMEEEMATHSSIQEKEMATHSSLLA